MSSLRESLCRTVLLADGAMGTMLQNVDLTLDDFEGYEGVFVKVKGARDRRVVISLQGVIAMAMATLSPDLIEVIEEPKKR